MSRYQTAEDICNATTEQMEMVPFEPTDEMLDIFPFNSSTLLSDPMDKDDLRKIYQTMISIYKRSLK